MKLGELVQRTLRSEFERLEKSGVKSPSQEHLRGMEMRLVTVTKAWLERFKVSRHEPVIHVRELSDGTIAVQYDPVTRKYIEGIGMRS